LCGLANLTEVDSVGRDALFLDELLDLVAKSEEEAVIADQFRTRSSVFAALSLTNGLAMAGILWLAVMWPLCELTRSSDMFSARLEPNVYKESWYQ